MKNSFAKDIRSRAFFVFSFFTFVLIVILAILMVLLQEFFAENAQIGAMLSGKSIIGVFLVVNFWSLFISIVFGISAVQSDMEHMILPQILAHPISRTEYIIGRVLGSWMMVGIFYLLSLVMAIIAFSATTGENVLSINLLWAIFPAMARCLGIIVLSVLVSLFLERTTSMISMIFFTIILSNANSHFLMKGMAGLEGGMLALKAVGLGLHWIFPRIGAMAAISNNMVSTSPIEISYYQEIPHFILITGLYLFILNHLFNKKDI